METPKFPDRQESVDFYNRRYSHGYMSHWSDFEKQRLSDLVKELDLPEKGKALDFGCGRGIFTSVLKEALPSWEIYGCDISKEAIESASTHFPGIQFFILGDPHFSGLRFDFIHSHHVLEHTFDEKITAGEMCDIAEVKCTMLHSLPCNHPGSLEYKVSGMMKEGYDKETGKFFFEDPAHLRRMNSDQVTALFIHHGFFLWKDYYSNQQAGVVKWIAESNILNVLRFSDPLLAKDFSSALYLSGFRIKMLFLWYCCFVAAAFEPANRGRFYILKKIIQILSFLFFFWIALPIRKLLLVRAKREWKEKRKKKNGAEMFIILKR